MSTSERNPDAPDAIVVGAGVIGLSVAWRAAQEGLRVRVLERGRAGGGASGVAAGMLAPVGEVRWGEDELLALALRSHAAWPAFAAGLAAVTGRAPGHRQVGALHVALDRDEAAELRRRHELMREHGLDAEWLGSRECRRLEPGLAPGVVGGVHARHEAAVDPRELTASLLEACRRAGVDVREGCEASAALLRDERLAGVRSADGEEHRAERTVLAAGAWSAAEWLPPEARPRVRPVKGQILTLRASAGSPPCERIVASERFYAVPRADGTLVVGATVEEAGFDTRVTAGAVHELLRESSRALPDVAELELVEVQAGLRPGSPDNAPLIGRAAIAGLVLATGHFRNGVLLAPVTAELVLAELRTQASRRQPEALAR